MEACSLRPRDYATGKVEQTSQSKDKSENNKKTEIEVSPIFGTPEDDAFGRDFTINSLFYNINTNQIEDFTKRGLQDLENGVISTTLPPAKTMFDDPIRAFRAIRFACKFNFVIDNQTKSVIKSNELKTVLKNNIARERIFTEFEKNIKLENLDKVMQSLLLFNECELIPIIFPGNPGAEGNCVSKKKKSLLIFLTPRQMRTSEFWNKSKTLASKCVTSFQLFLEKLWIKDIKFRNIAESIKFILKTTPLENRVIVFLAALLMPLCQNDVFPVTKFHMLNHWKWPTNYTDGAALLFHSVSSYSLMLRNFVENGSWNQLEIALLCQGFRA